MAVRNPVRFCNNPLCERLDEHLRPREILRKAGRDVCPACHEELVTLRPPARLPRRRRDPRRRGAGRPRHEEGIPNAAPAP